MKAVQMIVKYLWLLLLLYGANNYFSFEEEYKSALTQQQSQLAQLQKTVAKNKKDVQEISSIQTDVDKWRDRVVQVQEQIQEVQKQLPSESNRTDILDYLSKESQKLNIRNARFEPGAEKSFDFYVSNAYSYSGLGTYQQFLIFLERLANAERLFNISSLTMSRSKDGRTGRYNIISFQTRLESYRYNSNYKGIDKGAKK